MVKNSATNKTGRNHPDQDSVSERMRFRPKPHQYVAFALFALAGVVYSFRLAPVDMPRWKPLDMPIQLKIGAVRTPEFTFGLDTDYRLFVESEHDWALIPA
jgi:hypothetical protein